ncbi:MAG TPA: SIS domain-containing protein, partial [Candidatus Levybacteria bacterium]|nr:SIS domain-containing protein [Candidatus Levybacteria bacterium]
MKSDSLVVALSQSGETIDIISSLKSAKEKNAKIMAITNVLGSTLYRMSDFQLMLNAGPEKCVLATKSFTAKITYLYLLAHTLNGTLDTAQKDIEKAVKQIEVLLKDKKPIHNLAKKIKTKKHIYILGRGVSYPTALESAL